MALFSKPYIVFEGIDGSGKTYQARVIHDYLESKGFQVEIIHYTSKEWSVYGKIIKFLTKKARSHILGRIYWDWNIFRFALFCLNARSIYKKMKKRDLDCDILIGDRSIITTYANHQEIIESNFLAQFLLPRIIPNYVIILDLSPNIAISRIIKRNRELVISYEELCELRKIYKGFIRGSIPTKYKSIKWSEIDSDHPIDIVSKNIIKKIDNFLDLDKTQIKEFKILEFF